MLISPRARSALHWWPGSLERSRKCQRSVPGRRRCRGGHSARNATFRGRRAGGCGCRVRVLAAPALVRPWLERDAGLVSLVDSVGEQRSVLGRLTGGFPHAPLGVPSAGGQDGRAAGTDRVQLTAGRIRESFGERETPSQLHALGVSQLLAGRYDDAAQSLLAASREQPANAQYLSDVAAVQLERARLGLRPDDLPRALAAADRARRLDPSLKEAWFNRALAASALSLTAEAKAAWTEYLKRDSASPWAAEARARLERVGEADARRTRGRRWKAGCSRSIDAATADAGGAHADRPRRATSSRTTVRSSGRTRSLSVATRSAELERVRVMAEAMLRVAGDALYRDAVAAIDRAEAAATAPLACLAAAHQAYATAAAIFMRRPFCAKRPPGLAQSTQALDAAGQSVRDSCRRWISARSTTCANRLRRRNGSSQRRAERSRERRAIAYAAARAHWVHGLDRVRARDGSADAQAHYEDTLGDVRAHGRRRAGRGGPQPARRALTIYLGDEAARMGASPAALRGLTISRSPKLRHWS